MARIPLQCGTPRHAGSHVNHLIGSDRSGAAPLLVNVHETVRPKENMQAGHISGIDLNQIAAEVFDDQHSAILLLLVEQNLTAFVFFALYIRFLSPYALNYLVQQLCEEPLPSGINSN